MWRELGAWPRPSALAESQQVRTAVLAQRAAIERAWGPIEFMSDRAAPGRLVLRTARGHVLVFGIEGGELWVDTRAGRGRGA